MPEEIETCQPGKKVSLIRLKSVTRGETSHDYSGTGC